MTIDERVGSALAELREALGDGCQIEEAIAQIAAEFDLKPEVLRHRAQKEFGSLDKVSDAVALERAVDQREALIKSAFKKIRVANGLPIRDPEPVFAAQWEKEVGFSVSEYGDALTAERARCALWRAINEELDAVMHHA